MFERVLIATDLSEKSFKMLQCLEGLKKMGCNQIILVHCIDTIDDPPAAERLVSLASPFLERQRKKLEGRGFTATGILALGTPQFEIERIADQYDCSIIVVGSKSKSLSGEMSLGGVASAILYSSLRPVLVFRLNQSTEQACYNFLSHVIFPTDFSKSAAKAFEYVERLAEAGCRNILLLHVQEQSRIGKYLEYRLEEFNRIDRERLEALKKRLIDKGATHVDIEIPFGSAKFELLERIKDGNFSLLVIGSQGRGFMTGLFLGSVSHSVAQKAEIPVLFVPARG